MPQVILPSIRDTDNPELKYQYLYDAYVKLRKELSYLLGNLDSDNVLEAQSVVADWVYAGTVTTDQLIAGEAKISTALIEDLVVGGNVAMGPNATISWSNVTNQPSIPSQYTNAMALAAWENSGYATYIDANGVYSGSFNGGMFNINPTGDPYLESGLTIGGYQGSSWKGQVFKIQYDQYGDGGFPGVMFSSQGGAVLIFEAATAFENAVEFRSNSDVSFNGDVDFGLAHVTGLNYASVNHNHGNDYVKSYTGQNLSLVATETGIVVRVNGVTLGSIFYD